VVWLYNIYKGIYKTLAMYILGTYKVKDLDFIQGSENGALCY